MASSDKLKAALKTLIAGVEAKALKVLKELWATFKPEIEELQESAEYERQTAGKLIYKATCWTLKTAGVPTTTTLKNKIRWFLYAALDIESF